jgi:hypothetical protein
VPITHYVRNGPILLAKLAHIANFLLTLLAHIDALVALLPCISVALGAHCIEVRLPISAVELWAIDHLLPRLGLRFEARTIECRPDVGTFSTSVVACLRALLTRLLTIALHLLAITLRLLIVGPVVRTRDGGRCCGPGQQQSDENLTHGSDLSKSLQAFMRSST